MLTTASCRTTWRMVSTSTFLASWKKTFGVAMIWTSAPCISYSRTGSVREDHGGQPKPSHHHRFQGKASADTSDTTVRELIWLLSDDGQDVIRFSFDASVQIKASADKSDKTVKDSTWRLSDTSLLAAVRCDLAPFRHLPSDSDSMKAGFDVTSESPVDVAFKVADTHSSQRSFFFGPCTQVVECPCSQERPPVYDLRCHRGMQATDVKAYPHRVNVSQQQQRQPMMADRSSGAAAGATTALVVATRAAVNRRSPRHSLSSQRWDVGSTEGGDEARGQRGGGGARDEPSPTGQRPPPPTTKLFESRPGRLHGVSPQETVQQQTVEQILDDPAHVQLSGPWEADPPPQMAKLMLGAFPVPSDDEEALTCNVHSFFLLPRDKLGVQETERCEVAPVQEKRRRCLF